MREQSLTQGNLSRKLRQLLVFLTLVLVPIGAWGDDSYFAINTTTGGIWVTDTNADNILSDDNNKMEYDVVNNVLTLNGINLELSSNVTHDAFIALVDGENHPSLTVKLVGDNTVTLGDKACFFYGASITFTAEDENASLTIITENEWSGNLYIDFSYNQIYPTYNSHLFLEPSSANANEYIIQTLICEGPASFKDGNNIVVRFGDQTGCTDEEIHYSIDYVDENLQDVPYTVWVYGGGDVLLSGPCTMTYYITAGGGQSETKTAKLFGLATNSVSTNLGIPVALPTIVPAFDHSEDLIITETQTPATGVAPVYDGTTGLISTSATGETTCSVKLSNSTANGYDYLVLNDNDDNEKHIFGNFTLTVNGAVNYGISVGGVEVTSANAANIIGDGIENGTVTFTPASDSNGNINTLTINNATLTGPIVSSLDNLTIHLVGENIIKGTDNSNKLDNAISTAVSNATLNFTSGVNTDGVPTGKLLFPYVTNPINGFSNSSIVYNNGLDLGVINDNIYSYCQGIGEINYSLMIGDIIVSSANCSNIIVGGNSIGSFNNSISTLTLNGASLTNSIAWSGNGNFIIELIGSNSITTGTNPCIKSEYAGQQLFFSKGNSNNPCSLTLNCNEGINVISGFNNDNDPTIGAGLSWTVSNNNTNNAVVAEYYGITIAGIQVTSANADNITGTNITPFSVGEGKVSFTPASSGSSNTLTLNGAAITGTIESSLSNLTIHLIDQSVINPETGEPAFNNLLNSNCSITFTSAAANSNNGLCLPFGINNLVVNYTTYQTEQNNSYAFLKCTFTNNFSSDGWIQEEETTNLTNIYQTSTPTSYGITVAGVRVTSANADNITGDNISVADGGKVSYEDGVLTLNKATINGCIYSYGDLTIDLKGLNIINATDSNAIKNTYYDLNNPSTTTKNLTFNSTDGTGELDMQGKGNPCTFGFNDPTYNNSLTALIGSATTANAVIGTQLLGGGNGSSETPYLITSPTDLKDLARYVNMGFLTSGSIKLNDNIDCNNLTGFEPIGNSTKPFTASFDGGSNTISNLSVSSTNEAGLFGQIGGGTVQNLTLSNCSFSGGSYTGGIVGYFNSGSITGCNVNSCTIETSGENAGAIVGYKEDDVTLSNNYYNSAVTVKTTTGGNTTTKSGQTQRGIGNGNDVLNQVMLSGTKKITIVCTETYNSEYYPKEGTYYLFEDINSIYALPNSVVTINAYPASDYIPALSLTDNITVTTEEKTESGVYDHTEFSFTMPNADVTATLTFSSIINYDIASCTVTLPESATYNGEAFEPVIYETATATTPLTPGTDYTVSYQKTDGGTATDVDAMIDAGTYKITITGAGNYTGTKEVSNFQIGQANLDDATISKLIFGGQEYTGTDIEIPYTGAAIQPSVVVTINDGQVMIDPSEYSVSWSDNIEISGTDESAKVTITSTGKNFTENSYTEKNFKIVRGDVTITANDQTVTYNGNAQEYSNATVDNANATLAIAYYPTVTDRAQGSNELTGAPTDAGTYYVEVIQTDDNFMAEAQYATFTIEQAEITEVILEQTELIYNKEEQTVNVDKVMAGTLEVDADYYEISGNIGTELGDYTVTVTAKENSGSFKNNFKGSATTTFKIIKKTVTIADLGLSDSQTFATYYNTNEDVYLPDGVVAYIIVGVSENSVTVKRISYIPKGVAVLVELGSSSETAGDDADGNLLVGTSTQIDVTAITGGTVYVLYNGEFVKTITGTIPANHCYLVTTASSSRKLTIVCDDTTAIDNGRLTMDNEAGEQWYDLQGWKIEKPNKAGLYIKNGKKTVIYNK